MRSSQWTSRSMEMTRLLFLLLTLVLLLPQTVSADVSFPISQTFPITIIFIVLIEFLIFGAMLEDFMGDELQLSLKRLLAGIIVANLITSTIGEFTPAMVQNMVLGFAISVPVEWLVYIPFLAKYARAIDLLKVSFLANLGSYGLLFVFISIIF